MFFIILVLWLQQDDVGYICCVLEQLSIVLLSDGLLFVGNQC